MSSQVTAYHGAHESNPYPPSNSLAPGSQQPLGLINPGNQVQGGQPYFLASPGIVPSSQVGQGNIQINPASGTVLTNFKEAKTLGAIQIVIGSMHIGFGIILGLLSYSTNDVWGFGSLTFIAGYPFWGGICIKSSLGMNIVSSIFALIGAILLLVDMCINHLTIQAYWALISGKGISAMLMIFSLLEICITCTTAHFARQMVTNTNGYIVSGVSSIRSTQNSSRYLSIWALTMNIFSVITALIALSLTIIELSTFNTVSYRNYGQAVSGQLCRKTLISKLFF
ncbi:Membrane-spanning 4-domains subfamily A member 12 [Sciurus carolinensis]|uniref:Membrane-spanning 4-domains subfamily A member 12 n=1 Tax=Sciurus carolinensis TaxID=30640 RepID=A0AA41MIP4_SCICA|nr:Membrane-spanning 4-domains subfamily A member 12 [Sciurus carolinensis]